MLIDIVYQGIAVIAFICEDRTAFQIHMFQEWYGHGDVIALSFAEEQVYRISVGVYDRVDLRTGAAAAVSDLIGRPPFLAPALC